VTAQATVETIGIKPPEQTPEPDPKRNLLSLLRNEQFVLLLVFLGLVAFFSLRSQYFWTLDEVNNVSNDFAPLALLAVGQMFVIVSGGIDLSVGACQGFSGVVSALLIRNLTLHYAGDIGTPDWHPNIVLGLGLLVSVLVGTGVGLLNSFFINRAKLVPFIATLITMGGCTGLSIVLSQGRPVGEGPQKTIPLAVKWWGPFSRPVLVIFAVLVVLGLLMHLTRFGRYTFALGSNAFATRGAGINVQRQTTKIYALSGFLAGLSGFYLYLRLGTGAPTTGSGSELSAIAAVVIGGVALSGGIGRITGTILGALMIETIKSGLIQIGLNPSWKPVVVAGLIAVAATIQANRKGQRKNS
jgi:ribose transport system permease protein